VVLSSQVGLAPVAGFFFLPIFLPKTFPRDNDCGMRSEILPPDFGCQVFFPHRIRGCISRLHLRLVPPRRVFFWVQNKARRGILVSLPFGFLVRPFAWQCCLLGEDGKADSFLAISFPSLHFGAPFTAAGRKDCLLLQPCVFTAQCLIFFVSVIAFFLPFHDTLVCGCIAGFVGGGSRSPQQQDD
jgi:hypothetical protein